VGASLVVSTPEKGFFYKLRVYAFKNHSEQEALLMVKHIILWKLKEEFTQEEKNDIAQGIKEGLEQLSGVIPGLLDIHVQAGGLASSNVDVMLDSTFESEEALQAYTKHPAHVEVADTKVRPFTILRSCLDFEV
jgi:hypothetical protein